MIDDTLAQLSDETVEPLLLDILGDRNLNEIIQKCSSSEQVEIEIKISQNGQQLLLARRLQFVQCPCNQHPGYCFHSVDANNNPICN